MVYFVSTPIGNLKDVTFRAVEVLKTVDLIACEDTRTSSVFLSAYGIEKPLVSYHKFNEREAGERLLEDVKNGKNVAVISDAGTPVISDPGNVLTKLLIENGLPFTVVPGATAFTPALLLSGLPADRFCFLGFLPEKDGKKRELLDSVKTLPFTLLFYCAPHDVERTVKTLSEAFGNRRAVAVREITKVYEEAVPFSLQDGYPKEPRGEFVIAVEGYDEKEAFSGISVEEHLARYVGSGMSKMDALKRVAKERGVKKSDLYKYTLASEKTDGE